MPTILARRRRGRRKRERLPFPAIYHICYLSASFFYCSLLAVFGTCCRREFELHRSDGSVLEDGKEGNSKQTSLPEFSSMYVGTSEFWSAMFSLLSEILTVIDSFPPKTIFSYNRMQPYAPPSALSIVASLLTVANANLNSNFNPVSQIKTCSSKRQ